MVPPQGRCLVLSDSHRLDLPGEHVDHAGRVLLLAAGERLGRRRCDPVRGTIPDRVPDPGATAGDEGVRRGDRPALVRHRLVRRRRRRDGRGIVDETHTARKLNQGSSMSDVERWFWLVLLVACLVWYSTITIYVAVQGYYDIRQMLSALGAERPTASDDS